LRCYWCHNPESQDPKPELAYWEERCQACGTCVEACPRQALRLAEDRIVRDRKQCAACGACADACLNRAMEKIGCETAVREIVERVIRDRAFYDHSGGGVTITGGEPTLQSAFLLELLEALKSEGLHIALETCGFFDPQLLSPLLQLVNLFLYDLKQVDSEFHRQATGVGNEKILDNFTNILGAAGAGRIIPRAPLIPGFNIDERSIKGLINFLKSSGYHGPVHLMPYHGWAKGKYQRIGRGSEFRQPGSLDQDQLQMVAREFGSAGFEPICHG